jgi:hypothetical protein
VAGARKRGGAQVVRLDRARREVGRHVGARERVRPLLVVELAAGLVEEQLDPLVVVVLGAGDGAVADERVLVRIAVVRRLRIGRLGGWRHGRSGGGRTRAAGRRRRDRTIATRDERDQKCREPTHDSKRTAGGPGRHVQINREQATGNREPGMEITGVRDV